MLARGNGVALWRQIYARLERDIVGQTLRPGDRLPSENQLSRDFGVNRHTIRRAMSALEGDGLIRVEHGRGSFVREPVIDYSVQRRTRFSENLASQHRAPGNVLIAAVDVEAEAAIADALNIKSGELVTCIVSAGEADGHRISYSHSYFPRSIFPGMVRVYRETESVTRTMKHFGITDYFRKQTRIISRMPTAEESRHLEQPNTRPVLITESVNVDSRDIPVEFGVCVFASDWVQLLVEPSA